MNEQKKKSEKLTPEILVPRLGDLLIEKKIITPQQFQEALDQQNKMRDENGIALPVGQILVKLGYVSRTELDHIITEQVIQFRAALESLNMSLEERVTQRTYELEQALKRLAELNQLKANFISNISHELRTPLTHLQGYLELLGSSGDDAFTPEQWGYFQVMEKAFDRLEKLIQDLIDFSISNQSVMDYQMTVFSTEELCQSIFHKMQPSARSKDIVFDLMLGHSHDGVYGDRSKITWVMQQLLDNAIKFSKSGDEVHIQTRDQGDRVVFSVADTGIGIPSDRIAEIFEPFHQLDGSATRKSGGVGIGLSLAQRILEAHQSQLEVTSEEGKGSTFYFVLHCLPDAVSEDTGERKTA